MGIINHCVGVRYSVTGSGNLQSQIQSKDEVIVDTCAPLAMQAATDVEPFVIANFSSQKTSVYLFTDQIDETFKISRMEIFIKPTATSYPQ